VNVSPKGVKGTFHAVEPNKFWYEDLSGSGVETISHIRENGRITILFNAFEGPPRIARLFGTGRFHEFGTKEYDQYIPADKRQPGSRAVIIVDVHKVGTSCGWGIPYYQFLSHRPTLNNWAGGFERPKSPSAEWDMKKWWRLENTKSIDGLTGLSIAGTSEKPFKSVWDGPIKPVKVSKVANEKCGWEVKTFTRSETWMDPRLIVGLVIGVLLSSMVNFLTFSSLKSVLLLH